MSEYDEHRYKEDGRNKQGSGTEFKKMFYERHVGKRCEVP